ncbi:Os12g0151900 [Oryza sativa Japonica Group]|uniref:Os12g0151900 protein n=3 Tax=Oryza TaxID=4527 RepID=Q0IQ25_ORYSJ|nr:hypothetical protein EE612_057830 [Oryza sativa]BAF29190.1 Os12g0151900 [Oryza sativa Japonica Group]BAT15918.1 Os12g0151900 [Oryza sativa Japonica Group]|eukprot:NP_001066171.1 Os12g0151900 [Oryza sativa Japonica Group]
MVFIYHSGDNDSWNFLASPGSSLSLSIEVDSSDRKAKFVLLSKLACIEMIPRGWHNYSLPTLLLEEHKNEPVDTNAGLWALIAYDFPSCNSNARKMHIKNKYMQAWNDLMQVRERTYQKRHPLFQVTIIFVHGLNESITSPITRPTTRGSTDLDMVGALEGQMHSTLSAWKPINPQMFVVSSLVCLD